MKVPEKQKKNHPKALENLYSADAEDSVTCRTGTLGVRKLPREGIKWESIKACLLLDFQSTPCSDSAGEPAASPPPPAPRGSPAGAGFDGSIWGGVYSAARRSAYTTR